MKRSFKSMVAISLVACMTLGSAVIAFAADVDSVNAGAGDEVTVDGNVTSGGVQAGSDSTVEVTGNVTGNNNEYAMGIMAANDATVTVGGDVTSNSNAIEDEAGPINVTVGGDVTSFNGEAICAGEGSKITVGGNATGSQNSVAIQTGTWGSSGATTEIVVGKDVSGKTGVYSSESSGDGNVIVAVEGTLSGTEDAVVFSVGSSEAAPKTTVLAYKVEGSVSKQVGLDDSTKQDASQYINYIIVKNSDAIGYSSGVTSYTVNGRNYDTSKEGNTVVVTVQEGYGLSAGSIEVTRNADGTFSIVVPKGGGVSLEAIKAVVSNYENNSSSSGESTTTNTTKTEVATPVSVIAASVDPVTMGEAAYTSKVTSMIADAPYGGTIEINVTSGAYLNDLIISALETRSDVSLKINVVVDGVPYVLNIPAGFNLRALLGADGKIDLQKLIAAFGTAK